MFDGINALYLGSKKKGDEYLSTPISNTLCLVAFILKLVIRSKQAPRLTTRASGSGLTETNSPFIST